jgi:polyprenyldihydroxybenzoate methyltransferase/3-demethylubiquinol 3-O-methyltransferase
MAEQLLREVPIGTHTYAKYINPSELIAFFQKYPAPRTLMSSADAEAVRTSRPWITTTDEHGLPTRREAEVRGMAYMPWNGQWKLFPRQATSWGGAECNYMFWVRKPADT